MSAFSSKYIDVVTDCAHVVPFHSLIWQVELFIYFNPLECSAGELFCELVFFVRSVFCWSIEVIRGVIEVLITSKGDYDVVESIIRVGGCRVLLIDQVLLI